MKIHKEGLSSVGLVLAISSLLSSLFIFFLNGSWLSIFLSVALYGFALFVTYFFREPNREIANAAPNELLASADGKIVIIKEVDSEDFMGGKSLQVSIFMSVFNVHINYYPIDGKIIHSDYHPGDNLVAWHPKSSVKNERTSIGIETITKHKILLRQIAGYIARRIVCYSKENQSVKKGTQLGFIKFGSRVDYFLPIGSEILVNVGDKVKACQTIIAKLPNN